MPWLAALAVAMAGPGLATTSTAQIVPTGGLARPFTVEKRGPGTPIRLQDYAGQILVLDFFAHWCGSCRTSSPDLETNVRRHYQARGGNPNGVPVTVLSVNIESGEETATDTFIRSTGLEVVANDYGLNAYSQFDTGDIPLFVIINGLADAEGLGQWQVLYRDGGYPGAAAIRRIIDPIRSLATTRPPKFAASPIPQLLPVGEALRLDCAVQGAAPIAFQWFRNGLRLAGATNQTLVVPSAQLADAGDYHVAATNALGSAQSATAKVRVAAEGNPVSFTSTDVGRPIPDAGQVDSILTVSNAMEILRLRISVQLNHTYPGDLEVSLLSPAGTEVVLRAADGNPGGAGFVLDRAARPEFAGQNAQGEWRLRAVDRFEQGTGTLISWSIEVVPPALDVGAGFAGWMASFPGLTVENQGVNADPDHDGLVNYVEFLMADRSPVAAEVGPGLQSVSGQPNQFEYQLKWRPGLQRAPVEVEWSEAVAGGPWSAANAAGSRVVVDQSQAGQTTVRIPKDRSRFFLRIKVRGGD